MASIHSDVEELKKRRAEEIFRLYQQRNEERQGAIHHLLDIFKFKEQFDMVFVIDGTGSMRRAISNVKNHIQGVVRDIKRQFRHIEFSYSAVIYRDYCDEGNETAPRVESLDFTKNVEELKSYLENLRITGGGDEAEDVLGGLEYIMDLDFREGSTRLILHFADAPCHGTAFHSSSVNDCTPEYSDRDKTGVTKARRILRQMKSLNVEYHFVMLNNTTEIMVNKFQELSGKENFPYKFDCPDVDLIVEILESSIAMTITTSLRGVSTKLIPADHTIADYGDVPNPEEPVSVLTTSLESYRLQQAASRSSDWDSLEIIEAQLMQCRQIINPSDIRNLPVFDRHNIRLKVNFNPIGDGASRTAYHAKDVTDSRNEIDKVIKLFKRKIVVEGVAEDELFVKEVEDQAHGHMVAEYFAMKFNERRPPGGKPIRFISSDVLHFEKDGNRFVLSCEPKLDGAYEKWTNNAYPVSDSPTTNYLMAFSHFSYEESKHEVMVADLQGTETEREIILTDPAILSRDTMRYGMTNLGVLGMQKILSGHTCDSTCAHLGLNRIAALNRK